jgi:hypothetical protein
MKTLSEALWNKFSAVDINSVHTDLYIATKGQLYKERAKQNAILPYVVYHIISDVPEWNFCSDFEKVRIQFDLYSEANSSTEVEDLYAKLKSLFDWQTLTIVGWDHVYMKRELARLSRDPTEDVWTYNADYEIFLEKQ